jgi:hypothetical protein
MTDFKSTELSPYKETTPQKTANRADPYYDRYSSAQLKTPTPAQRPINLTRDEPFQSLQHIPDAEQLENARSPTLTPKAKNEPA